jgi:PAS domain S-box-containing protein
VPRREAFDRLTDLAAAMFDAPIALITVLEDDRQWFRSNHGFAGDGTTRGESFCAHAAELGEGAVMVVEDAVRDPRFVDNRLVTEEGVRFYAGGVITTADGRQDGAVCVIDTKPRGPLSEAETQGLRLLARMAAIQIEASRAERVRAERVETLKLAESMAGVGNWRLDVETGEVTWSAEVFRIHGLKPGEVDPTAYSAVGRYHPEDQAEIRKLVQRAIATGEGYDARLRLYRGDGEERVTRAKAQVGRDAEGRITTLFGVFQDITEQVRDRERLVESEALFRLMAETSTDVVARFDTKGRFLFVSPSAKTVLGRDPAEMIGKDCTGVIPEDDLAEVRRRLTDYVAAGPEAPAPRYEYRALKADGTPIWLEATPRAIRDDAGRLVEFHDCVRDVTARKTAERAQRELVETLSLAEDLAGLGCWRLDVGTGQVRWSDQVYRIHGVTPQTFDPSLDDAVAFYHPDDRQAVRDWCAEAIGTGESGEFKLRLIRADGQERIVVSQCRPQRDEHGRTTALFGVFQDVTDRVRAEEALSASEARYRLMADHATDVIATYGMDGVFTYLSPSIVALVGHAPEDMVGRKFSDFMHPEDVAAVQAAFGVYVAAGPDAQPPRVRYRATRKDGQEVWLEAHPKVIRDAAGRPIEFQDLVRDVTETKRLEEQLLEARDVAEAGARAKTEFLANMSHELRTPLTSVVGFAGLLQEAGDRLGPRERLYADRIATASQALLSVINDILDYSKLEADRVDLDPHPFDPRALARGAAGIVESQCAAKGIGLAVIVDPDLPDALMGDEGRLRQVTLNFLSNAAKFTGTGGIRLEVGRAGDRLRVAVADTGIGVAPDKIAALFERFTQADASTTRTYGGTGLGLAISRRLIEMMGGEIGAESRPGAGSTFWFEIPLIEAEGAVAASASEAVDAPTAMKVLMADDAPANRELVTAILGGMGVAIETVENGALAVEAARTGSYDVILMDVHMPVMDGLDATRAIRAMDGPAGRTPIVALTANVQPEQVAACRASGMDAHVGKPIQVAELLRTMAAVTAKTDDGDEAAARSVG